MPPPCGHSRFRRVFAGVYALILLALTACGRIGIALLPNDLEGREELPGDGSTPEEGTEPEAAADSGGSPRADAGSVADASSDAQPALDAQAGLDARVASDASAGFDGGFDAGLDAAPPVADASTDAGDAAQAVPGTRIVVDYSAGSGTLSDYAVRVLVDTRALIQQGQLAADCSNLRIFGGAGCSEARSYFLPAYACNSTSTELWLRVPQLQGGAREVLTLSFDGALGEASDGARVFSFFDDFTGSTLDGARWIKRGQGTLSVASGVLQGQGVLQIESVASAVSAGQAVVGARLAMLGAYDTDVELGVGKVNSTTIWAPGRTWDGVTFVSYTVSTYAFDGPAGTSCDDLANSMVPPQLSATPWVDTPPAAASFLTAEFAYTNRSGRTEAWLRSSRGASLAYNAPAGCTLPAALPVLITFDHNAPDAPLQRVDYVYVRPSATSEPSASVMSASSLLCGSTP